MAGSKSLELYLPDKNTYIDKNIPILTVNPPKRLHDAAGLLNDMFEKLGSIIYTSSSFSKKLKYIDIPYEGEQDINKFLKYADDMLEDSTRKANNLNEKLQKYKRGKSNDGAKELKNNHKPNSKPELMHNAK